MLRSKFSKVIASSIVALSVATTGLHAGLFQREPGKRGEGKDTFAFAYPKDMNLVDPADVYFYVEGLAMQASQGGLEYGILNNSGNANAGGGSAFPVTGGKVYNFDWSYNPGVRVGLGGYVNHDAWMIEANWTWLHFTNYESVTAKGSSIIIPTWVTGGDSTASTFGKSVSAGWNGHYNVVDTMLGKPYHISRCFIVNPTLGLRLAFIDQNYDVEYSGFGAPTDAHLKNNFWGIGLRAGMNSEWVVSKQWRFFGGFAGALLRGHYAVNQKYSVPPALLNSLNNSGINEHFWDNAPVLEMNLGVQWGMHFNCDKNYVAVRAAYEFQEWFDQLQIRKIYSSGPSGVNGLGNEALRTDFSLNGFTLALQFDF